MIRTELFKKVVLSRNSVIISGRSSSSTQIDIKKLEKESTVVESAEGKLFCFQTI